MQVERGEGVPADLSAVHQVALGVARQLLRGATGAPEAWGVLFVWRPTSRARPEASLLPVGSLVHWLRHSGELGREVALRVEEVRAGDGALVPVVIATGGQMVVTYLREQAPRADVRARRPAHSARTRSRG